MNSLPHTKTSYVNAILAAHKNILINFPNSLLMGINVTSPSAIFGSIQGLHNEFGNDRVIETPASENAVTGIALGLATSGYIPILIHIRLDFAILSLDMLLNQVAKWKYMYGEKLKAPLIIRLIVGRGWGQGPQHSQALHNIFMHVPGFRVFTPSTPQDIYSSLLESASSDSPTIIVEHRWLYETHGEIDYQQASLINNCRVHSNSKKSVTTVVTTSFSTNEVLRAKYILKKEKIYIDVVEVVRLDQLDLTAIIKSLRKTQKLLIADIGHEFAGAGSSILAEIVKHGIDFKTPPIILGLPRYPAPTSPSLSSSYYPSCHTILKTILKMNSLEIDLEDPDKDQMVDVPGNRFIGYY